MATYQGKILARSPFYITAKADAGNTILTATLDVYIWYGLISAKPSTPNYTILKTAITATDTKIIFEVSQLLRDYFEHNGDAYNLPSSDIADALYFEYDLDVTQTPDAAPATINNYHIALDGYGYHEEGVNPTGDYAITNNLTIPEGEDIQLPVFVSSDGVNTVKVYSDTDLLETIDLTSAEADSNSNSKTQYLTIESSIVTMFKNVVEDDSGTYEVNTCFNTLVANNDVDKIELYYDTTLLDTINVSYVCEPKYTPKSVKFYAKDGLLNEVYMFKRSDSELNIERKDYNSIIGDISQGDFNDFTYNTMKHQYKQYNVFGTESITLNSGFVDETQNEVFKQLLLSEMVWIDDKPVNVSNNSLKYKTRVNDKLINYQLSFDYAYNTINNIY